MRYDIAAAAMRLPHAEPRGFDAPEPVLDGETFLALVRQRAKAVAWQAQALRSSHSDAAVLREQSEESQGPTPLHAHEVRPPAQQAAPSQQPAASKGPSSDVPAVKSRAEKAAQRVERLEAKRNDAAAKRHQAAKQLEEQKKKLAEVQESLVKLNDDKHELVLQLKQALQQEGSMKRQATQATLLSPRMGSLPGEGAMPAMLTPMDAEQPSQPAMAAGLFTPPAGAAHMTAPMQHPLQQGTMMQVQSPQMMHGMRVDRRDGRERHGPVWGSEDEAMEEGEVTPSPRGGAGWPGVDPSHGPHQGMSGQGTMRNNNWLPPHLQSSGIMPRPPSWHGPLPGHGGNQLPPHLSRQNSGSFGQSPAGAGGALHGGGFMQGGMNRPRPGHMPPAPSWGGRDNGGGPGPGGWQSGGGSTPGGKHGMGGRRGPYYS